MTDETINKLITIRAMGVAKISVKEGSAYSQHNDKVYPVDDISVNGDKARVSLDINGTITDFTQDEVNPA